MLTVKETAQQLGVSAQTVYCLCMTHKLRHFRVGVGRGKILVSEEAIMDYLKSREVGAEPLSARRPRAHRVKLQNLTLS